MHDTTILNFLLVIINVFYPAKMKTYELCLNFHYEFINTVKCLHTSHAIPKLHGHEGHIQTRHYDAKKLVTDEVYNSLLN